MMIASDGIQWSNRRWMRARSQGLRKPQKRDITDVSSKVLFFFVWWYRRPGDFMHPSIMHHIHASIHASIDASIHASVHPSMHPCIHRCIHASIDARMHHASIMYPYKFIWKHYVFGCFNAGTSYSHGLNVWKHWKQWVFRSVSAGTSYFDDLSVWKHWKHCVFRSFSAGTSYFHDLAVWKHWKHCVSGSSSAGTSYFHDLTVWKHWKHCVSGSSSDGTSYFPWSGCLKTLKTLCFWILQCRDILFPWARCLKTLKTLYFLMCSGECNYLKMNLRVPIYLYNNSTIYCRPPLAFWWTRQNTANIIFRSGLSILIIIRLHARGRKHKFLRDGGRELVMVEVLNKHWVAKNKV